tara:strand:- start:3429 stop:3803 length:375 start_codon:yes stop_codon:yes gene_type:complete
MYSKLSQLKYMKRSSYINGENTESYDLIIKDIERMIRQEEDELLEESLIESMNKEYENNMKSNWYNDNFDTWVPLPARQNCQLYSLAERLRYSQCRLDMFEYMENKFKKTTFPNLADRIEFFED